MFNIKSNNPNYLAKIIRLSAPSKHPNADKLIGHNIFFNQVFTDLSYKEGDIVIYFPLECAINKEFISFFNGFSDPELNKDKVKGYFYFPCSDKVCNIFYYDKDMLYNRRF